MTFQVDNKVAVVTGGVSGIGLAIVKRLLENKAKGVVMADINTQTGENIEKELQEKFGNDRVLFVKTDVSDSSSFENAFEVAVKHFENVDILFNNAGTASEGQLDKLLNINFKGVINGITLGMKFLKKFKQDDEGVIVNTASVTALLDAVPLLPIYTAAKLAVIGLTKSYGVPFHFDKTGVRVVAICPGVTNTPFTRELYNYVLSSEHSQEALKAMANNKATLQSADRVAEEAVKVVEQAPNGTIWIIEDTEPAYQYLMPDKDTFKNNILCKN